MPKNGGLVCFKTPRSENGKQEVDIKETDLAAELHGSIGLPPEERKRILKALKEIDQKLIDVLTEAFQEEKDQLSKLRRQHAKALSRVRKKHYTAMMAPELAEMYQNVINRTIFNESPEGVHNLVGVVHQLTETIVGDEFQIKGGSWFSENPKEACKGWASETIRADDKRMDVGFRCVFPIFSRDDLESLGNEMSDNAKTY